MSRHQVRVVRVDVAGAESGVVDVAVGFDRLGYFFASVNDPALPSLGGPGNVYESVNDGRWLRREGRAAGAPRGGMSWAELVTTLAEVGVVLPERLAAALRAEGGVR